MPLSTYRDPEAFEAMRGQLIATGVFRSVIIADPADLDVIGVDRAPAAVIMPTGWTETWGSKDERVRRVNYTLTLLVRGGEGLERYRLLDGLAATAQLVINGSDLGGVCLPATSQIDHGRLEVALKRFEGRANLTGAFTYVVSTVPSTSIS